MPQVPLEQSKPTVYLDWSHLTAAQQSLSDPTNAARKVLLELVEEVQSSANLCLSTTHIIEAIGLEGERARQTARWLDSLDFVFIDSSAERLEEKEAAHALLRELGASLPEYTPFTPPGSSEFPSCIELLQDLMRHPGPREMRSQSVRGAAQLNRDRNRARAEGIPDANLNAFLDLKFRRRTGEYLMATWQELLALHAPPWLRFVQPTYEAVNEAIVRILQDEHSLPGWRTAVSLTGEFASEIRDQDPNSKRFRKHESWQHDCHHAISGSYCDVFTCDRRTFAELGDLRGVFGKHPALCEHKSGGIGGLATAVRKQLKAGPLRRISNPLYS